MYRHFINEMFVVYLGDRWSSSSGIGIYCCINIDLRLAHMSYELCAIAHQTSSTREPEANGEAPILSILPLICRHLNGLTSIEGGDYNAKIQRTSMLLPVFR